MHLPLRRLYCSHWLRWACIHALGGCRRTALPRRRPLAIISYRSGKRWYQKRDKIDILITPLLCLGRILLSYLHRPQQRPLWSFKEQSSCGLQAFNLSLWDIGFLLVGCGARFLFHLQQYVPPRTYGTWAVPPAAAAWEWSATGHSLALNGARTYLTGYRRIRSTRWSTMYEIKVWIAPSHQTYNNLYIQVTNERYCNIIRGMVRLRSCKGQINLYTGWVKWCNGAKSTITSFDWIGLIMISFITCPFITPVISSFK